MTSHAAWQRIMFYILAYALWLASMGVGVVALLELRLTASEVWVLTGHSLETLAVANQAGLLVGGLVVLVYVLWLEEYYRCCAARLYTLLRRFAWTVAIPVGVLLLSLLTHYFAPSFIR